MPAISNFDNDMSAHGFRRCEEPGCVSYINRTLDQTKCINHRGNTEWNDSHKPLRGLSSSHMD